MEHIKVILKQYNIVFINDILKLYYWHRNWDMIF